MQHFADDRRHHSATHRITQKNMGKRPVKVVPVGAWVELEPQSCCTSYKAILSAEEEEQRISQAQAEKQARLERFRRDVKQRVRQLQQIKRQENLQESFHAVEIQSNVVQQSSHAAERSTPKKDRCLYRHDNEALTIGQSSDNATSGSESEQENSQQLSERSHRVHRVVTQAKRSLAAKKGFYQQTKLPGGSWGSEFSRDKKNEPVHLEGLTPSLGQPIGLQSQTTESDSRISQQPIDELSSYGDCVENNRPPTENNLPPMSHDQDALYRLAGVPATKSVTFAGDLGKVKGGGDQGQHLYANEMRTREKVTEKSKQEKGGAKTMQLGVPRSVPDLRPGVHLEENKRRTGNQYSMYRRLFMDIEREQVRENIRKKDHQKNIQRLKEVKEKERKKIEAEAQKCVEPRNPTGETELQMVQCQREEQQQVEQLLQRERQRKKKSTEIERYIRALKAMMREKISKSGVELPPLCACGPSIWDSNPDTCANNCIFYKNPKAYATALHTLLTSCDLS
ncbi:uncharacterized protein [Asterias amurensis]|uniref:uncharacterized protein n=1 Tax=Asterias amurensis TaxID=7602 RepID=UPI003AB7B84F